MVLTTNYNTDLGSIFVSYADVQTLIQQQTPVATLVFTNTSTSVSSSINFYDVQTHNNTYNIEANTLVTLIVYSGYYVNATIGTGSSTTYYSGNNYTLINNNAINTLVISSVGEYQPIGEYWYLQPNSLKTFNFITGNNVNSNNIVLAINPNTSNTYSAAFVMGQTATLSTNAYFASSGNLNNLSFQQIILTFINVYPVTTSSFTANSNAPVAISNNTSNNNSIILLVLVVGPSLEIFYLNATSSGYSYNSYVSVVTASTTSSYTLCQVQVNNGLFISMIAGSSGLYTNSGTSTYTSVLSVSILSISMNTSGEFQVACGSSGIYYSNNYGVSFSNVQSGSFTLVQISSSSKYAIAYLYTTSTLYISETFGATWTVLTTAYAGITNISISYNGQNIELSGTSGNGTYYSNDYGSTFTSSPTILTNLLSSHIFPSVIPLGIACSTTGIYTSQSS